MADIELVIKIPEEAKQIFDCAKSNDLKGGYYDNGGVIGTAIKNGTPLPKGHGTLKDTDAIKPIYVPIAPLTPEDTVHYEWVYMKSEIDGVSTIIEADTTRDCKTCGHSNDGKCAFTEECHECMWVNKYIEADKESEESAAGCVHYGRKRIRSFSFRR